MKIVATRRCKRDECLGAFKTSSISQLVAGFYLQSKWEHVMWKYIEEPQWVYWKFRNENFLVGCCPWQPEELSSFFTLELENVEASVNIFWPSPAFIFGADLQDDSRADNKALDTTTRVELENMDLTQWNAEWKAHISHFYFDIFSCRIFYFSFFVLMFLKYIFSSFFISSILIKIISSSCVYDQRPQKLHH